jgi:hypothetical protein
MSHDPEEQINVLYDIRDEVHGLREDFARIDERTKTVANRLESVEQVSQENERRSVRNAYAIGLASAVASISLVWALDALRVLL